MNIVFLCREYDRSVGYGGIGTYVDNISKELAKKGHKVFIISSLPRKKEIVRQQKNIIVYYAKQKQIPGFARLFSLLGLKTVYLRIMCAVSNYFAVKKLLKNYHIDIIETPEWFNEGLFCELFLDIPVVCYSHGCVYYVRRYEFKKSLMSKIVYFIESFLEILTMKLSDSVVALTENAKKELQNLTVKVSNVIPHGYVEQSLNETEDKNRIIDEFKVLFIGRIEKRKNPITVIKAIPYVLEKLKDVKFIFVGEKDIDYFKNLEIEIKKLNIEKYVEFLGVLENKEVRRIIKKSDLCVIPSLWETFGMVLLENIFLNTPIICSDIPVFREIMGKINYKYIFPAYDYKQWAYAIVELLTNESKRSEIIKEYSILKNEYSLKSVVEKKIKHYQKVISQYKFRKIGNFLNALPKEVCGNVISSKWRNYVLDRILKDPALYHFYLVTARQLLEAIGTKIKAKKILDFGSTPIISCLFALCGAEVTLIDIDEKEINKAKSLVDYFGLKDKVKIIEGNFFTTQIDDKYDIVYNCGVIEHFSNSVEVIKKMRSYTVEEGMVVCLVPYWLSLHSLFIRKHIRWKYGYFWDSIGDISERSYNKKVIKKEFLKAGLTIKYLSTGNLARNICDDHIISFFRHRVGEYFVRKVFINLFKIIDVIERYFVFLKIFGFSLVCSGINKNENN
ncbi:MAG: glycosyltransferase [Endomicrobiia bacterium]